MTHTMKRPTQSGLLGIVGLFLLVALLHFFLAFDSPTKHTLVLFCNRHRTNLVSIRPEIPKWEKIRSTSLKTNIIPVCVLEGRYRLREEGPLPQPVTILSCANPPKPLQIGVWKSIHEEDKVEIDGWDLTPQHRPCFWQLGYFYREYRLVVDSH